MSILTSRSKLGLRTFGLLLPMFLFACGASKDAEGGGDLDAGTGDDSGDEGGIIVGDDSSVTTDDTGSLNTDTGTAGDGVIGDGCAGSSSTAQLIPLDIYLMMDQSGSMTEKTATGATKWDAVKSAINTFVADPNAAGIGIGVQFFAQQQPGVPNTCFADADCKGYGPCDSTALKFCTQETEALGSLYPCATNSDCPLNDCQTWGLCSKNSGAVCPSIGKSCGGTDGTCSSGGVCKNQECGIPLYSTASVEIAPLPGSATAIKGAFAKATPNTDTPTEPALAGAVKHAEDWAKAHGHKTIALLATDGLPTACCTGGACDSAAEISTIAKIASDGKAAGISTYVIGIFTKDEASTAQPNLDQISKAGNGAGAIIISSSSGDAAKAFLDALNKIRGAALSCEYQVPTGAGADFKKVNVEYTPAGGAQQTLPYTGGQSACGTTGGWYYDVDPSKGTPTKIIACPSTCTTLQSGGAGSKVNIVVGCATIGIR